jgi:hypothetical protein
VLRAKKIQVYWIRPFDAHAVRRHKRVYMHYELTRMKYAMKKLTEEDAPYSALCFGVVCRDDWLPLTWFSTWPMCVLRCFWRFCWEGKVKVTRLCFGSAFVIFSPFVLSAYICWEWVCNDWLSVVVALVNRPRTTLVVPLSFVNQVALLFVLASSATWRYVWAFFLSCVLLPLFIPFL